MLEPVSHPDAERRASRQLASALRGEIERGDYAPGAKLPSYRELRDAHQVALNTAQAAIRLLAAEGLVDIRPASGAFVRDPSNATLTVREELEDVQAALRRSKRELTRAEGAVSGLLARIAAEGDAR
jgi:DNA-binding FadR family transcriptional regulator